MQAFDINDWFLDLIMENTLTYYLAGDVMRKYSCKISILSQ